jgi:hypothetical protein
MRGMIKAFFRISYVVFALLAFGAAVTLVLRVNDDLNSKFKQADIGYPAVWSGVEAGVMFVLGIFCLTMLVKDIMYYRPSAVAERKEKARLKAERWTNKIKDFIDPEGIYKGDGDA